MAPHANADVTPESLIEDGIKHNFERGAASKPSKSVNGVSNGATSNANAICNGGPVAPSPLTAAQLIRTRTTDPRHVPAPGDADYHPQRTCSDHMISATWRAGAGWAAPALHAYGALSLLPTASVLHYATSCFEGLKLYRGADGRARLFRPALNCARMRASAARVALPDFEPEQLLRLIVALCERDAPRWLPRERPGACLYVRPSLVASEAAIGVQRPSEALLFVVMCLFAPLDERPGGMRLLASKDDMVRAWPGGFGYAKVGANYGPTLVCQAEARERDFDQILWLFGPEGLITEAGASNFFVIWRSSETGRVQLVTAPLTDRIILDGVTRRSIIELAQERLTGADKARLPGCPGIEPLEVVERPYSIAEVRRAYDDGRLLEAFVAGTAFFVTGVREIEWRGQPIRTEVGPDGCGRYAALLKGWLKGIMFGKERHEWAYVINEEES